MEINATAIRSSPTVLRIKLYIDKKSKSKTRPTEQS